MLANRFRIALVAVGLTLAVAASASAQVFGTFSWRMEPYCNIVTLTITQIPGGYTIDGNDNQCGVGGKLAGAAGMALLNPDGTVGLEFTIVTAPAAKAVHVSASVSPANGSGTWTDSVGNTGNFALGSPGAGSPRPLPSSGVGPATITTVELAPGAVGATQLAPNAVTGASVVNGSLTSVDLLDGPRAAFTGPSGLVPIPLAGVVVRTVTLVAPGPGKVIVNGAGTFRFTDTGAGEEYVRCSITQGTTLDGSSFIFGTDGGSTNPESGDAFGITRGFDVTAGSFTANLFCDRFSGTVNSQVFHAVLTAMFVAQ